MPNLIQLTGGAFQDSFQNPVAFGTLVLKLTQSQSTGGSTYEDLSPYVGGEVCDGIKFTIPLDGEGNIVLSPAYFVFANDDLHPSNSFYLVTLYSSKGQLLWGPNSQQVLQGLSPYDPTFDVGQWVPNEIIET